MTNQTKNLSTVTDVQNSNTFGTKTFSTVGTDLISTDGGLTFISLYSQMTNVTKH